MLTLLVDLDDTLIENSMDSFLPAYLQALGKQLEDIVPAQKMIMELMTATRLMIGNQEPGHTLEDVFDRHFYPAIGSTKAGLLEQLNQFYRDEFPRLAPLTRPKPQAQKLIDYAIAQGYTIVVATNPLFPETAIHQRLDWAGFPTANLTFELITHYSAFHFAKPNPAYFAEILALLGWPDHPAVMIGNELSDDILPASLLGIPCYWLQENGQKPLPSAAHPLSQTGDYSGIAAWLEQIDNSQPVAECSTPESLLAVLRSTPAAISQWVRSMPLTQEGWNFRLADGEWGLTEIICHLRDVDAEVHLPRLERVIHEDNPHLLAQETDPWAVERDYRAQNGPLALLQFIECRSRLLSILSDLTIDDWQRPAQHTIFGPTTLFELVGFIATHDRTHIQQAHQTLQAWKNQSPFVHNRQQPSGKLS